ncbi:Nitrate transporter 1.5 [Platanthera zijinensis]|uniref:Nitrate transporter 1.5 n=1 Tax=Platanthera zijinensis TaxID=2320716 RepID=A0AAP0FUT6_9ASPA
MLGEMEQGGEGHDGKTAAALPAHIGGGGGEEFQQEYFCNKYTADGSVDISGHVAVKACTGGWVAGSLILVNQGLATLAFFGVGVNLVLFLTRVVGQNNADAANNVSKWTGTVYIFSLVGAFLSDSYWGRYKTCAVFQLIFVMGLIMLSLTSQLLMLRPSGCGDAQNPCESHSGLEMGLFSLSIYLVALGNGGYQPNIATFGADQFEEGDPRESHSKISFFSYFYLALNLGSLFSNTFLSYFEDEGMWALGFWISSGSALSALVLFLCGTQRYRYFRPCGNPLSRVCQVIVAAFRKWKFEMPTSGDDLYEMDGKEFKSATNEGSKKILHSDGFRFLDRAALVTPSDDLPVDTAIHNPWRICTVTQVEEVKCVLRLLPIWLCTILYSVVFTQMASLFVEQGAAMNTVITGSFRIPPASMSAFDILSVSIFIFFYRRLLQPLIATLRRDPRGLTELHRMGLGLIIAIAAMVAAGIVEHFRLKSARTAAGSLNILWQVPQYMLIGASEVFMYVGQLEFFNEQAPDGLKSFGSALCMTSISLGNYVSDLLVTAVMQITGKDDRTGWIPANLNRGHMDRFYFLLAALTGADLVLYVVCARCYKCIKIEGR